MFFAAETFIFLLIPLMVFGAFSMTEGYSVQLIPLVVITVLLAKTLSACFRNSQKIRIYSAYYPLSYLAAVKLFSMALNPSIEGLVVLAKLTVAIGYVSYFLSASSRLGALFKAYYVALIVSVIYAMYQYIIGASGADRSDYFANLPIHLWNGSAWHNLIIRDGIVRAQGFAFEPAYLDVFLAVGALGFLVYPIKNATIFLGTLLIGFLISLSRNGEVFVAYFLTLAAIARWLPQWVFRTLPFVAMLVPVALSIALFGQASYDDAEVSIVSRLLPLQIFAQDSLYNYKHLLVGVENYSKFIVNAWPLELSTVLVDEKVDTDPKSLVGFMLYNFGVIGLVGYVGISTYVVRNSKLGLFIVSSFTLVAFNIGSLFWPVAGLAWVLAYKAARQRTSNTFFPATKQGRIRRPLLRLT